MEAENKKLTMEISTGTIFKVLFVLFIAWILYLIRDVVAILFFAIVLVSIFEPWVSWLSDRKVPKGVAVFLIYLIFLSLIAIVFLLVIPPITDQFQQLSANFPLYWEKISNDLSYLSAFLNQFGITDSVGNYLKSSQFDLSGTTGGIFSKVSGFLTGIFSLFIVMVITFYILVQEGATKRILRSILPIQYLPYAYQMVNRVQKKLGLWLRGELILCLFIALLAYVGLLFLNVKYALILALIAGVLEFIPYLGPSFAGIVAIFITFFQSPVKAFLVLILYIVIQLLEHNVLVPNVMQRAVGLNPVVSIVALLIGGQLGGIFGAVLAIPVAVALSVIVEDLFSRRLAEERKLE
ncbi:MAG: AI-2E family transporter [Patescibacteria group bacterium]|nr:AI-2E family transporter [Patescibacteria group bacterium]